MPSNIPYPIVDLKNRLRGRVAEKERSSEAESRIGEALKEYSRIDPSIIMTKLASSYNGLTRTQVSERLLQYGPNLISSVKPPTRYKLLFQATVHPFNILQWRSLHLQCHAYHGRLSSAGMMALPLLQQTLPRAALSRSLSRKSSLGIIISYTPLG
ncbi:hypothetical protein BC936DRAFT_144743 [Jimgerdemannia flammicorona]|uniref:Cation-transporting P-type ATPase N-terminal domain-containing protein n=1 Tax=Jimgerdemannia flammicorona TaxID=994334 RepID=A0A433DBU2_9FUNG|nr:hypothetical protein BC936DRAFT_144743 [Jimgerdemannia flammicorona]